MLSGGVIGKDFTVYGSQMLVSVFYVDSATLKPLRDGRFYSENVLFVPLLEQKLYYYGLKYAAETEQQMVFQIAKNEAKPTNAIDFINVLAPFLQIKCTGVGEYDGLQKDILTNIMKQMTEKVVLFYDERDLQMESADIHLLPHTPDTQGLKDLETGLYLTPDKTIYIMSDK